MTVHTAAVNDTAWRLFTDWCTAVAACPLPATVATISDFFDQVPAAEPTLKARLRAIRRAHQAAGVKLQVAREPASTAWRGGPGWLPLVAALARCEVGGWPSSLRGRRDAFLLVAIGMVGLTRSQTVRLSVDDITWPTPPTPVDPIRIKDQPVEPTPSATVCPACAVTRWLRVAALENHRGQASVRHMLALHPSTPTTHDCTEPAPARWREVWQLAPAVDQYGEVTDWRPMSTRAVSTVLATRLVGQHHQRPKPPLEVERPEWDDYEQPSASQFAGVEEPELWAMLEERIGAADATNARIDAILADAETLLGSLSHPAPPEDDGPEDT